MSRMEALDRGMNSRCIACGEFPVNHFSAYIDNTLTVWQHDRMQCIERWGWSARFSHALHAYVTRLEPLLITFLHKLSGGRIVADPARAPTERARVLWQEAVRRGIKMEQVIIFGSAIDSYRAYIRDRWIYFDGLPIPGTMTARAFRWADDKLLFKRFLKQHQLPRAEGGAAASLRGAHELLARLHMPVVVKPRIGSNSRHTTPLVTTHAQFEEAFKLSQELGKHVLIEEYFYGHLCRATVVDDKLVGFLESRQATVTGDGSSAIQKLVDERNSHKMQGVPDIVFTEENIAHLRRQGYEPDSILDRGATIRVVRHPGRGSGGENREMLGREHPKLREYVERTAELLQSPIVGFDLIIDDPEIDPDTQKWGILEANTVPFIEIHADPLYGEPSNVAAAIWDLWQ